MSRNKSLDRVQNALPDTPTKKMAVVASLVRSPTTRNHLKDLGLCTSQDEESVAIAQATLADATEALNTTKKGRSDDARSETDTALALLTGERVTRGS